MKMRMIGARFRQGALSLLALIGLSACIPSPERQVARLPAPVAKPASPPPIVTPPPVTQARARLDEAPPALITSIRALGASFDGQVGIAVRRIDGNWTVHHNGDRLFPQQSVSKLWVGLALMDAVDRGKLSLDERVTIRKQDLTLFHQPIARLVDDKGYETSLRDLFNRAMTQSDNTANDVILRRVGGPDAVRGLLARRFIANIRFGPGERLLQSAAAGLQWNQAMSQGRTFYTARANLPRSAREKALDAYLADPPDGAAPNAIALALAKLARGEMVSPAATRIVLDTMEDARTGPQRIKGGVPAGWSYGHKTGTGQDLAPRSTGYNDVGIMTAPDGTRYAVVVMIGSTTQPVPARWALMQSVARAVAASHPGR